MSISTERANSLADALTIGIVVTPDSINDAFDCARGILEREQVSGALIMTVIGMITNSIAQKLREEAESGSSNEG